MTMNTPSPNYNPKCPRIINSDPNRRADGLDERIAALLAAPIGQAFSVIAAATCLTPRELANPSTDVRDNISGFEHGSIRLRDPQGKEHYYYVYHDGYGDLYPSGDPSEWETFTDTIILPRGSAPGIWGLTSLRVDDRAENERHYDFTEVMRFVILDSENDRW